MQQALFKLPYAVKMGKECKGKKTYCEIVYLCSKNPFEKDILKSIFYRRKREIQLKRPQIMRYQ